MTTTQVGALRIQGAERALAEARAVHGRGSSQGAIAFQTLCQEYARQGRRIDELDYRSPIEEERFFARTAQGPDGHVYWHGPRQFERNDGQTRRPGRWWWEYRNGPLAQNDGVVPICGERGCVNPEHAARVDRRERALQYPDARILGALQTYALRNGAPPTREGWDAAGQRPTSTTIMGRFGGWHGALRAAGVAPASQQGNKHLCAGDCTRAIRKARQLLNRWPTTTDFDQPALKARLRAAGLPARYGTIKAHLGGSWAEALRRAGKS